MYGLTQLAIFDNDDQGASFSEFDPFLIQFKSSQKAGKNLTPDIVYAKEQVQIMKEVFEKIQKKEIASVRVAEKQSPGVKDHRLTVAMRKQQLSRIATQLSRRLEMYKQGVMEDHDFFINYAFPLRNHQWILQQPLSAHFIKDCYYIHLIMDYKILLRRHDKLESKAEYLRGNYKRAIHRPYVSFYFPFAKSKLKLEFNDQVCFYKMEVVKNRSDFGEILEELDQCQFSTMLHDLIYRLVLESRDQSSTSYKGDPSIETEDVSVDIIQDTIYWEWKYPGLNIVKLTLFVGEFDDEDIMESENLHKIAHELCKKARYFQDLRSAGLFSSFREILLEYVQRGKIESVLAKFSNFKLLTGFSIVWDELKISIKCKKMKHSVFISDWSSFEDELGRNFPISYLSQFIFGFIFECLDNELKGAPQSGVYFNRFKLVSVYENSSFVLQETIQGDIVLKSQKPLKSIKFSLESLESWIEILHNVMH
eukprot:NODE_412_length_7926_cov_1.357608.p3 type:complete len:479 gc:universal NODE_412_length_7926_cov_1.357608:6506-5070(-)